MLGAGDSHRAPEVTERDGREGAPGGGVSPRGPQAAMELGPHRAYAARTPEHGTYE